MRETDGEIVAAVLGGATESFAKLVERHDRRVRAIVAERVRDPAARERMLRLIRVRRASSVPSMPR